MRAPALLLLLSGVFACAADLTRETLLLQRARVVMASNLARLPNYTCVQTIERFTRAAPTKKPKLLDVVRLEVALVEGKELFAWPGSGRFSETEIGEMVKGGAIGNGIFALHAKAIFQTNNPRFTYIGLIEHGDRKVHKWDYVVPQNMSGWHVRVGAAEAVVGYHGSIYVDAETLDLVRLEVNADDAPPALLLLDASVAVEFVRTDIGGEKFLLPARSDLSMVALNGSESANRTTFTGCRQYSGESRILFDDPDPAELAKPAGEKVVLAPKDLRLDFALETPLVFRSAAVGDPVTAKLQTPLKLPDGLVIAKGALVHGRLTLVREQQYVRNPSRVIGLKFFEIESPGVRVRLSATLEEVRTAQPGFRQQQFGPMPVPQVDENVTGSVFFVHANTLQLPKGLRMVWRTKALEAEETQ